MDTPTNKIEIQKGYRHPPHSAVKDASDILDFTNIITPSATNKPNVAVVCIQLV